MTTITTPETRTTAAIEHAIEWADKVAEGFHTGASKKQVAAAADNVVIAMRTVSVYAQQMHDKALGRLIELGIERLSRVIDGWREDRHMVTMQAKWAAKDLRGMLDVMQRFAVSEGPDA